jgi:hypothetical protein
LTNAGTATLNLAAASDLTVGGSQIDHDDMAGAAVVASTGGLNIDEDVDIDFDAADEEMSIVNSAEYGADGAQVTIENTDADVGAAMYLLRLRYTDDGQANADFAVFEDNNGDDMIAFTDGGNITAQGVIGGATLTEGGNAVYNSSETPGGELGGTWASPTVDDTGITLTSITIGALLGVDSIDVTGAADIDIGSADCTDVTIITDGGTDSLTIGNNADLDFGITFDSDSNDGTINWNEDNATFQFSNVLANTPQAITYNADDDSETVGSDITSSVVLITTDNDATDETIDIQDGTVSGQMVTFICVSGCDGTDDGVNVDVETDSTCTGCDSSGIYALGTNGDSCTIVWDGTNSAWYEVGYKIQ